MPTEFNWALCSHRLGDGHQVIQETPERPPTQEYLARVTRAAEDAGFANILVPTGTHCMDPWATSAALSSVTEKIKFLIAFRPGLTSPTLLAQQVNTLDYLTDGRVSLNVVAGATQVDLRRYGYDEPLTNATSVPTNFSKSSSSCGKKPGRSISTAGFFILKTESYFLPGDPVRPPIFFWRALRKRPGASPSSMAMSMCFTRWSRKWWRRTSRK